MLYDTLIIGGGPAGYTAALYAARAGLSVLLLEQLGPGGQMALTSKIDNYPGFPDGIDGFSLADAMKRQAERFGAQTKLEPVSELRLAAAPKQAITPYGVYEGKTVILALGAKPKKLGLPGEDALSGRGLSYCATCDGMFYRGKTAAVVGGGNTAVEEALYLSALCQRVFLIHRRDTLRADKAGAQAIAQNPNIEPLWNRVPVDTLQDENGRICGLVLQSTADGAREALACDGVFAAVGRTPSTEPVRGQVALNEAGYILADETTATSLSGVFAAGDARQKPLRQIVTAAADGAVAAKQAQEFLAN